MIRAWLWVVAFLIFCMVVLGGATRLTGSGLAITEWQPLIGAVPPLSEADWAQAFAQYQRIPEYALENRGMTLGAFKFIYWWEWTHRFLGRFIGAAFAVPFLAFVALGAIQGRLMARLIVILLLGALQGALGWYMVKSGLIDRVDVSQYRLAAHLSLAAVVFAAVIWTALGIGLQRRLPATGLEWTAVLIVVLVLVQIAAGGLVAGLNAGMAYNTWPLMDGRFAPPGLLTMAPAWRNLFENAATVQFDHRLLAYALTLAVVIHAWQSCSLSALGLAYVVLLQAGLGILTLVFQVPLPLALGHQANAMLVLATATWHLSRITALPRRLLAFQS